MTSPDLKFQHAVFISYPYLADSAGSRRQSVCGCGVAGGVAADVGSRADPHDVQGRRLAAAAFLLQPLLPVLDLAGLDVDDGGGAEADHEDADDDDGADDEVAVVLDAVVVLGGGENDDDEAHDDQDGKARPNENEHVAWVPFTAIGSSCFAFNGLLG